MTPRDLSGFRDKYIAGGARSITDLGLRSSSATLLPPETVLLTTRAPIGYVAIAKEYLATNQGLKNFICGPDLLPDYLYWYLKGSTSELKQLASGTTFLELSKRAAERMRIPVPPVSEQRAMVASIEGLVTRIDRGRELVTSAMQRLKHWRELSVRAALEGRANAHDGEDTLMLLQELATDRPRSARSATTRAPRSRAPRAPALPRPENMPQAVGWVSIDELCPVFVDCEHRTPKPSVTGIPALRPRDIVGGTLRLDNAMLVDLDEFANQTARRVPEVGDVVYSRELSYGWAVVVPAGVKLCLGQGMVLFRPHPMVDPWLVAQYLNSASGRSQAHSAATGTAHPHINLDRIRAFAVPVLSPSVQASVRQQLESGLTRVDAVERALHANDQRGPLLKAAVINAALRGRLTEKLPLAV